MTNLAFGFAPAGWARFSPCGLYRYALGRPGLGGGRGRLLMSLQNGSTATGDRDDPTVRRGIGFAQRERFDELVIVNPFGFCATAPDDLVAAWKAGVDIVGPDNDRTIMEMAAGAALLIMGCGSAPGPKAFQDVFGQRVREVLALMPATLEPHCLGLTAEGWPRHPLYLRADAPLVPWRLP